jgi:hypothetical protein
MALTLEKFFELDVLVGGVHVHEMATGEELIVDDSGGDVAVAVGFNGSACGTTRKSFTTRLAA